MHPSLTAKVESTLRPQSCLRQPFRGSFTCPVAFQGVTSAFPFYLVAKFLRAITCKFCVDWSWRSLFADSFCYT